MLTVARLWRALLNCSSTQLRNRRATTAAIATLMKKGWLGPLNSSLKPEAPPQNGDFPQPGNALYGVQLPPLMFRSVVCLSCLLYRVSECNLPYLFFRNNSAQLYRLILPSDACRGTAPELPDVAEEEEPDGYSIRIL